MHFSLPVLSALCASIATVLSTIIPIDYHSSRRDAHYGSLAAIDFASSNIEDRDTQKCTHDKLHFRREWRTLTKEERKQYTDAVLCLKKKPALYKEIIGAKSRYDDFQVLHIKQTFIIHFNAQFLPWHRWFTWTYEKALKDECGYTGSQPYWDWTLDAHDIESSPLFDGSPYSMSGNGKAIPNRPDVKATLKLPGTPLLKLDLPSGTGGGCVTSGPFANFEVPFGQVSPSIDASQLNNPKNLAYKPHCLRRDLNPEIAAPALTHEKVFTLLKSSNISTFNNILNFGSDPKVQNLHGAGHFGVGLDMSDTFSSPGDPIFFLHHAQIDRLWSIWQRFDPSKRQHAISGTGTFFNYPPSPEAKITDNIDLGKLSPEGPKPIRDFMDTLDGPFCYQYL